MIDLIERNVENAGVYVYRGKDDIKSAVRIKRTGRRVSVTMIMGNVVIVSLLVDQVDNMLRLVWLLFMFGHINCSSNRSSHILEY